MLRQVDTRDLERLCSCLFLFGTVDWAVAPPNSIARSSWDRLLPSGSGLQQLVLFRLIRLHSKTKRDPLHLAYRVRVAAGGRGWHPLPRLQSYPAIRRTLHSSSTFDEEIEHARIGLLENVSRDVLYALRKCAETQLFAVTIVSHWH